MLASCTLPWTRGSSSSSTDHHSPMMDLVENDRNDSAFCDEPEYSNPASSLESRDYQNNSMLVTRINQLSLENDEDYIPDYEEVDPVQVQQLRQSLLKPASMGIYGKLIKASKNIDRNADNKTTQEERIMHSLIYCIHKVILLFSFWIFKSQPKQQACISCVYI